MDTKSRDWIIFLSIMGLLTMIPVSTASKANLIGYYSLCTFVPISTLILFGIAFKIYLDAEAKVENQVGEE